MSCAGCGYIGEARDNLIASPYSLYSARIHNIAVYINVPTLLPCFGVLTATLLNRCTTVYTVQVYCITLQFPLPVH